MINTERFSKDYFHYQLNPAAFSNEVLFDYELEQWQKDFLNSQAKRVIITAFRGAGKSILCAALSVHRMIFFPNSLVLLVSRSQTQSSEIARRVDHFLKLIDPNMPRLEDNKLSITLSNGSRLVSLPNHQATIRGFHGADLIIVDEAAQINDETYTAVHPALNINTGKLILASTPVGQTGFFFETWDKRDEWEWDWYEVPVEGCTWMNPEFLEHQKHKWAPQCLQENMNVSLVAGKGRCFKSSG